MIQPAAVSQPATSCRAIAASPGVGREGTSYSEQRLVGLKDALGDVPIAETNWSPSTEGELASWLRAQGGPVAVVAVGDEIAVRVVAVCRAAGLGIPDPYAVLSLTDDVQTCSLITPALTAVNLPQRHIGAKAVSLMDQLIAGEEPQRHYTISPADVIPRASTAQVIEEPMVAEAVDWIDDHLAEPIAVEHIAQALDIGRRRLERRFAATLGVGVYQHLISRRLDRARERLRTTEEGLEVIAVECGFAGAQHLCDVFRSKLGETPETIANAAGEQLCQGEPMSCLQSHGEVVCR